MKRQLHSSGGATLRKPSLVVAGGHRLLGSAAVHLRLQGWEVVNVSSADAVRAALSRKPAAMLLPDETGLESGYLVAAKLREAKPHLRVVLVGRVRTPAAERFANFVGAGFVSETDSVPQLLAALGC